MRPTAFSNTILSRLGSEIIDRLILKPVVLELGHEIEFPGNTIDHLIFVEEGMASMINTFEDGSQVEVGMFGYKSVIGVSALMGTKRSLNRVYMQVAGRGFACLTERARKEFERGELFQLLCLRYVQAQLVQTMQSAGCNAKHHMEQRLARWLLITADRLCRSSFRMPQEFLADMVGSTRSTVSLAAGILKQEGLIRYSRANLEILDIEGLRRRACECYSIIKDHLNNLAEFDTGKTQ